MSAPRFVLVQIVNCAVWAMVVGGAGYLFGHAAERVLGTTARIERDGLIAVLLVLIVMTAVHRVVQRPR
jgi:membrane protein DedA with SNARE-associated domain